MHELSSSQDLHWTLFTYIKLQESFESLTDLTCTIPVTQLSLAERYQSPKTFNYRSVTELRFTSIMSSLYEMRWSLSLNEIGLNSCTL
ncbi:hypothetical protein TNCT_491061 [Trichonephila clavata]|uniref:Uncharacterized protein n=1 Tax=Trichonephila clavata TaxID=2740835 RepID=A0A8X6LEH1_TRICU|nr:hypothetical protein TNCT_491061 [Trichonephila clavata]